ncbi:hypothetical protein Tco_0206262 [Tanacetum coccineum]
MPRSSSDQLADNLHDVMMETLPSLVKEKVTEQVKKEVLAQVQDQVPVYLAEGLILERKTTKEETERLISKAILQERGRMQAHISSQIQTAIDNAIPSLVDASVRSYMSGHILHVHSANVQFYHLFQNFNIKLDDPYDDAHPEGENSAKRQKTSEYETYVSVESSSEQVNVEELGPFTLGNQEQDDEFDFWTDSYASDDDEILTKQEVDIIKKTENQAKMTKRLRHGWKDVIKSSQRPKKSKSSQSEGVDNRRITLIVIRARANSAVVISLMEFVLVVLMEMEIKSIFQLRTLLINLQFIYPEPDYSLDFNSPQDLHNLQQQNLCCENCRGPHATIECQPMSQNSHSFGFDQLQTPQFSVNHQPPQPMSMEALQAQEDLMKSIESFLKKFNRISFGKTPKVLLQAWDNFFEVKHAQSEEVQELLSKLVQDVKIISDELSEYINTPAWNRPLVYCDNDDDEDYTIAITPESPTKEPVNSLSLGDEHLDTIPATESDEFIKSSVENLVPTPIEFEDFSDDECDLPPYDDSSKNHDFTFSNPLFDIDEDFTLSDESFSEEDIPKENFIIFSNPLFDLDEEIASTKVDRINDEVLEGIHSIPPGIDSFDAESDLVESVLNRDISIDSSPKIDSLSNEFAGELILPKSIPPEIEEVEFDPEGDILFLESLLYDNSSPRPPEALQANSNAIESLPPSHIPVADNDSLMEEIDLFLADDGSIPPGIESDDVDSVDDDTSISLPEFESFYVDYPNSGNSTIDVVEDIPVDVPNVLPTHPILEQDFIPTSEFFAYVVWIFLPFLAYPVIPPSLLSCGDEDTIFDPGISKDCPDCEDSQFCHSSRVSHPQLHLGIRYPNLID